MSIKRTVVTDNGLIEIEEIESRWDRAAYFLPPVLSKIIRSKHEGNFLLEYITTDKEKIKKTKKDILFFL